MKETELISIQQFCEIYNTPISFFDELFNYEIISFEVVDDAKHIYLEDINTVEKLMRLHYDLNINMEGLDVALNLINQINDLQEQINDLKRQLDFYIK